MDRILSDYGALDTLTAGISVGDGSRATLTMSPKIASEITMKMINSIDKISGQIDSILLEIIEAETAAYFAGAKSAEDVGRIIQNRITTFLNERK